ncbi:hypothetical protein NPIL_149891 [Nephila pilipes]|uniref:Uncharacterized protein n=1 Tax=Nephila pilipes TaxID=299642 RepID=A0A8X6N7F6_NEPPI|nr:hypothetical protein NPIL_149891 [Nephila pilipes]
MARTKQALAGDSGSTANCAIGDSTASEMPSLEMEISIETPNQNPPLDQNIKKCQNVQFHIEAYTETIQKITEIQAIIKKPQLLPFLYGPQDATSTEELVMDRLKKIEGELNTYYSLPSVDVFIMQNSSIKKIIVT